LPVRPAAVGKSDRRIVDSARKLQFWDLLLECGFKEIEVAFPSASQTDFNPSRRSVDSQRGAWLICRSGQRRSGRAIGG
jgi:isopropylmalate/homocitrate/citramalate synthase